MIDNDGDYKMILVKSKRYDHGEETLIMVVLITTITKITQASFNKD